MDSTTLTSDQAEALIAGTSSHDGLEDLAAVIDSLRAYPPTQLDEALVDQIVAGATACVFAESVVDLTLESTSQDRPVTGSLRRHIVTVAASVALVFVGGSAVAIAADGASPGDALYGIDRALESVGIGDGGTQERFKEVDDLIAEGDVAHGLEHAAATLTEAAGDDVVSDSNHAASLALKRAAQRARDAQPSEADTTKEGVASLLDYLAENIGNVDGQRVAELARGIGNGHANNPPNSQGSNPNSANPNSQASEPGSNSANRDSQGSNQGKAPDEPPGQTKKDSENNSNSPPNPGNSSKPKQER